MKKAKQFLIVFIISWICFPITILASDKKLVTLDKCVDGDTAWLQVNGEKTKIRFLAIDTPESTNKVEAYGKEASEFTCNLLTNAHTIEIEYDEKADKKDKYGRTLVWIFVDGELLQNKIIEQGLAQVKYIYGDYKYTDILKETQETAKQKGIGIWSNSNENTVSYLYVGIGIFLFVIICICSKKVRKKVISKTKRSIQKEIKKAYKNL